MLELVDKLAREHALSQDEYAVLIDGRTPALADELRCALDEGALLSQADAAVTEQAAGGAAERAEKAADEVTA